MEDYFSLIRTQVAERAAKEKAESSTSAYILEATNSDFLTNLVQATRESPNNMASYSDIVRRKRGRFFHILKETHASSPDEYAFISWLLNSVEFVSALVTAVSNDYKDNLLTEDDVHLCSSLCYDYITQVTKDPDTKLLGLYSLLSKVVNQKAVIKLTGLGIPENAAIALVTSVNSSLNEEVMVRRLNWTIVQIGPQLMTIPVICGIYETLIKHMGTLFTYTMLDVFNEQGNDGNEKIDEVNSNIDCALLTELNEMPMDAIVEIIYRFLSTYSWRARNGGASTRFRLKAINSQQYGRILAAIPLAEQRFA